MGEGKRPSSALPKRLALSAAAAFSVIDEEEGCLLDLRSKSFYALNATATSILRQIEIGAQTPAIIDFVSSAFGVGRRRCAEDVRAFVAELMRQGLVEASDA